MTNLCSAALRILVVAVLCGLCGEAVAAQVTVAGTFKTPDGQTPTAAGLSSTTVNAVSVCGTVSLVPWDSAGRRPVRLLYGAISYGPQPVPGWIRCSDGAMMNAGATAANIPLIPNVNATPTGTVWKIKVTLFAGSSTDNPRPETSYEEQKSIPDQASVDWGGLAVAGITALTYTGYNVVHDEAVALTARTILNFTGAGVSCADNAGATRTDCTISGGGGNHNLLSATHADTTTATGVRGDVIVRDATAWARKAIGAANTVLASDGTDAAWTALTDAHVPDTITVNLAATATALAANPADCAANQFATAIAASGNLTCAALADPDVPDTITAQNYLPLAGGTLTGTLTVNAKTVQARGTLTASDPDTYSVTFNQAATVFTGISKTFDPTAAAAGTVFESWNDSAGVRAAFRRMDTLTNDFVFSIFTQAGDCTNGQAAFNRGESTTAGMIDKFVGVIGCDGHVEQYATGQAGVRAKRIGLDAFEGIWWEVGGSGSGGAGYTPLTVVNNNAAGESFLCLGGVKNADTTACKDLQEELNLVSSDGISFRADIDDASKHVLSFTTATANRTHTFPNAGSNTVIPDAGAANNFLTAISAGGVISKAQPAFANLSGTISGAQLGSGFVDAVGDLAAGLCVDTEILKKSAGAWACAADATGGTPTLDSIAAAAAGATINNGDNAIVWNWSLTTADKVAFKFSENTASTATGNPILLNAATIAASTLHPFQATARGTANGIRVDAATGSLSALGTAEITATLGDSATSFFSSGTIDEARLDANVVLDNKANTWSTGAQDMGAATSFILPKAAGAAPTAAGDARYDTTQEATKLGGAGAITGSIPRVLLPVIAVFGESKTNSVTTDQDFSTAFTIPANYLIANKCLRVTFGFQVTTGTSTAGLIQYVKLGSTKVFTTISGNIADGVTDRGFALAFLICGTAAAGASVNVETFPISLAPGAAGVNGVSNSTATPQALATNGSLAIVPGVTYSATGSTETLQLRSVVVEEIN